VIGGSDSTSPFFTPCDAACAASQVHPVKLPEKPHIPGPGAVAPSLAMDFPGGEKTPSADYL